METVEFQSFVFLYTLYGGILIGILYDIYRAIKGKRKNEKLITSIGDIIFLLCSFIVLIWAIFSSNYGDLRAYVFIGFIVGFFLYDKILSRIALGIFIFLKRKIIYILTTSNSLLLLPLKFLINLFWFPIGRIAGFFSKNKSKIRRISQLPKAVIRQNKRYLSLIIKKNKK